MPTILNDKVTISHSLGGCAFNDPSSMSSWPNALKVRIDDIGGWKKTAPLESITTPRGTGDGDYIASRFPARSRLLQIEGYITATSRTTLDVLFDLVISQAFPDNVDITLTRYEPIPKFIVGRLVDTVDPYQYMGDESSLRFSATLICADPFKYDAINTISGSAGVAGVSSGGRTYPRVYPLIYDIIGAGSGNKIMIFNSGTANTYPTITINGPLLSGWRVENSTWRYQESFDISLAGAADVLVINNQTKSATINGAPVNGLLHGSWWPIRPGSNTIRLFGNYDPAVSFSVSGKSRWR